MTNSGYMVGMTGFEPATPSSLTKSSEIPFYGISEGVALPIAHLIFNKIFSIIFSLRNQYYSVYNCVIQCC